MTRRRKRFLAVLLSLAGLATIALTVVFFTIRSDWFRDRIRDRIVSEVERTSGGRVEIGSFRFDWKTMKADVSPFVLHGTEPAAAPPLFRAASIQIGVKIISAFERKVDITSLLIDQPNVRILLNADGSTNIPTPGRAHRSDKSVIEQLLQLKIQTLALRNGSFQYDSHKFPFEIRAEELSTRLSFERSGPRYRGDFQSTSLRVKVNGVEPPEFNTQASIILDKDRLRITAGKVTLKESAAEFSGTVTNFQSPRAELVVKANLSLAELGNPLRIPVSHQGTMQIEGSGFTTFGAGFDYGFDGKLVGRGLVYRFAAANLSGLTLRSDVHLVRDRLNLPGLRLAGMGATFVGAAELVDWKALQAAGDVKTLALAEVIRFLTPRTFPWSGLLDGPVKVNAILRPNGQVTASADVHITPAGPAAPIEGQVDIAYDRQQKSVRLDNSFVVTPSSRVDVSGILGDTLQTRIHSSNLDDFLPALALLGDGAPKTLPVSLRKGVADIEATVSGELVNPRILGHVSTTHFLLRDGRFNKREIDRLSTNFSLEANQLALHALTLEQQRIQVQGEGRVALTSWHIVDASSISGSLQAYGVDLHSLLQDLEKGAQPIGGTASIQAKVAGTVVSPTLIGSIAVDPFLFREERFDRLRALVEFSGREVAITHGEALHDQVRIEFSGNYKGTREDWNDGQLSFSSMAKGLSLERFATIQKMHQGVGGKLDFKARGAARIHQGGMDLTSLTGELSFNNAIVDGVALGNIRLNADSKGDVLAIRADGDLRKTKVTGTGEWKLQGDYPGSGEIHFSQMTFATLEDLLVTAGKQKVTLPFLGFLQGGATLSGSLKRRENWKAQLKIDSFRMEPKPDVRPRAGAQLQDLALKNGTPIILDGDLQHVRVTSAHFVAKDTILDVAGTVSLNPQAQSDLQVTGSMNLAILQLFNADLLAQGTATLNASLRGSLVDPLVTGRLELKKASLYLADVPNGVDNANGVITFDRSRANIESLTAQTGGGQLAFSGFIGFGGGTLVYRLQAKANQVRFRYPEGTSTVFNALLSLTGTPESSVMSGNITIIRAGFNPRTDLAGLLAKSAQPVQTPTTPNDYLRGMQFDVRIESAPGLQFTTSLTRDIQAEVDLRLRGTPLRPILLGSVVVNQGELQFFGSRYEINRGEIRFLNPVKIEPIFDMDLETKARGITVNISFSGTLNKLNASYRSDPPLQSSEIIALLTVGRDPNSTPGLASTRLTSPSGGANSDSLLGGVLSAPVSDRLQRFFGVSRLKIDPTLTGIDNRTQARLTVEQQLSKDITLTYITNLTQTQDQLIRVEWDFSRHWGVVAVREENGVFGIDFQYRSRFK